ncbi:hypothetical protein ACTXT7_010715 [Hymenolepis weldensis]
MTQCTQICSNQGVFFLGILGLAPVVYITLDTILGRQGNKSPTAYNSHISLAARIVGIESN